MSITISTISTISSAVCSALARASLPACALGLGVAMIPFGAQASEKEASSDDAIAQQYAGARRFALMIGANNGGDDRTELRYAGTDARSLSKVLKEIGGVSNSDRKSLLDPTPQELRAGFLRVAQAIRDSVKPGEKVQFVFYYSGHSDEQGLLLAGELVKYSELRKLIQDVPADVRIGILDSCASGAFTRLKGGTKRSSFLAQASPSVKGHAYLTSSSADEAAQESDRIGGSFFTHYLVTGLRGAADLNRDRLITLNEAYRFAFDETLARTQSTQGGAQHAAYDIQLAGTGDLVMTDLRDTSAQLEIKREVGGRVFIRDSQGNLTAELYKEPGGGAVLLALEPGTYAITVDDGKKIWRADLTVHEGRKAELSPGKLSVVLAEATVTRGAGDASDAHAKDTAETKAKDDVMIVPFNFGISPMLSINGIHEGPRIYNFMNLNIGLTVVDRIYGFSASLGGNIISEELHGVGVGLGFQSVGPGGIKGFQGSVGLAYNGGTLDGVQHAVGAAITKGDVHGVQVASGLTLARGTVNGVQMAAGINLSNTRLNGAQLAVGLNLAKDVRGAQVGLANIAAGTVKGIQIGLFNYAEEADVSIGLITPTKKGGVWADVWFSDNQAINLAVKFRAKHTYTFLAGGVHPGGQGASWSYGLGLGYHADFNERLYLDLDLGTWAVHDGFTAPLPKAQLSSLRALIGVHIARRFAIWGGPTMNALWQLNLNNTPAVDRPGLGWVTNSYVEGRAGIRLWPGFAVGLEF